MTARIGEASRWFGELNYRAELTDREVRTLRAWRRAGWTYADLAEKFEVSRWCVGRICRFERRRGAGR